MVLYPNKLPESERVCSGICIVFYAMPEVTTFWEDAPSGLLRVRDTKQISADRL